MIKNLAGQLALFSGKCVRFIVYAFIWVLLLSDFRSQSAAVAKTSNATIFIRHILPVIFEMAGLILLPVAFFFARTESRTYRLWAAAGIFILLALLFIPPVRQYLLSLIHLAAL
jgi:hypothetical protein